MKRLRKYIISFLIILLAGELFTRFVLGLGELPVYIEDNDYEYIYAPNQNIYRFGNRISTNEFSMRSKPVSESDTLVILKFGDSVINGGAHVDQDSLSTSLLEEWLSKEYSTPVRVLNISAQSWGPDNAFAFLEKHGDFNASLFLLVFSSHDLHDNMHHKKVVGVHKAWPAESPLCALTDGWSRYLWPEFKSWFGKRESEYDYLFGFDDSKVNPGWQSFSAYCRENSIPVIVYLHPETIELNSGEYNNYGKQLLELLSRLGLETIQGIDYCEIDNYRDNIHLNASGHRNLARTLLPLIENHLDSAINRRSERPN